MLAFRAISRVSNISRAIQMFLGCNYSESVMLKYQNNYEYLSAVVVYCYRILTKDVINRLQHVISTRHLAISQLL